MKTLARSSYVALVIILAGLLSVASADARGSGHGGHGSRVGIGLWVGPGWWPGWGWPGYYPSYYPYYPYYPTEQTIVIQQQPEMYEQPAPQERQPVYWYFCKEPQGYYPYVKQCPGGWMKVVPTPPEPPSAAPE